MSCWAYADFRPYSKPQYLDSLGRGRVNWIGEKERKERKDVWMIAFPSKQIGVGEVGVGVFP